MKKIILVSPHGFCAGVQRAVKIVEIALKKVSKPLYIKHEIVHNRHVIEDFRKKGAIFVENIDEVPDGSSVIFSAHGATIKDYKRAKIKKLKIIDATCPLVTKVHIEARLYAKKGYFIIYIGHYGHPEAVGVLSNIPDKQKILIETKKQAEKLEINTNKAVVLSQTTISFDDAKDILGTLKKKFPFIIIPPAYDVCYATQNRQEAVKKLADEADLILVIGSKNSSNSNRLAEVARKKLPAYLIDDECDIKEKWLNNVYKIGITSGASAPENIIVKVIYKLKKMGFAKFENIEVIKEDVHFPLPQL